MNPLAYVEMAEAENFHWWYVGRRAILAEILGSLGIKKNSRILEVGCGTGGNLHMLAKYGDVSGIEMDVDALNMASRKTNYIYDLRHGHCPNNIPFEGHVFDVICIFDVLEHIEHDLDTLKALKNRLSKNGQIIITVPAYQWLYGPHDILVHHKRRYSKSTLCKIIDLAGLHAKRITHFNTFLFPIIALMRLKDRFFGNQSSSATPLPIEFINIGLIKLFSCERFFLRYFDLFFGASLVCVIKASE